MRQSGQTLCAEPNRPEMSFATLRAVVASVTWLRTVIGRERRGSKKQRSVRAIDPLKVPQHDAQSSRELVGTPGGEATTVKRVVSAG